MSRSILKPLCLVVDDEPDLRELSVRALDKMDCKTASNLTEAKEWLQYKTFDFCLTDMQLPDGNGIELVAHIVQNYPNTPVAMISAYGSVETAVQALKIGAFDFIEKPIEVYQLRNLAINALRLSKTYQENLLFQSVLVGCSSVMQKLREQINKIARSQAPICIQGESGSGKEVVARLIHDLGPRTGKPFVPVNCGAIPADLLESELFGHKKGSFTGAANDEAGLFQVANGGTLFLDEIAELPLPNQVKLLRAIQERKIRPIGNPLEIPIDVRILSATHRDLTNLVSSRRFREDLFYRINVIEVNVPPLRNHKEDIFDLVDHILTRLSLSTNRPKPTVSHGFLHKLEEYDFPGNVRELENIITRAITLCENNLLEVSDLQFSKKIKKVSQPKAVVDSTIISPSINTTTKTLTLKNLEEQTIDQALEQTDGNKTKAASLLGISLSALRYRLRKLKKNRTK